jgi:predicted ArsR family transcriptional regulator
MRWSDKLSSLNKVDLRDRVITRSIKDAFDVLIDSVPKGDIAKAVRPYFVHCGMAISINGTRRFNIKGKELKELATPYFWTGIALSDRGTSPMMVYEHGVVVETRDCCLRDIAPEFCLALSHQSTEGICRNLNPDFHYIFTHQMYDGDEYCRYILRRRGPEKDIEDLGELKETITALDMPDEEVDSLRGGMIAELLIIVTKVLIDLDGTERTLAMVVPIAEGTGREMGKDIDGLLDHGKGPKERAKEALALIRSSMGQEGKEDISKEGAVIGTTCSCPFKDGTVVLCKQYESLLNGICKAIDPKLEFAYTQMMTQGEPNCAWTIRRAPSKRKDMEGEVATDEDPLLALKMRFAKGEISEADFLKTRDILLEK